MSLKKVYLPMPIYRLCLEHAYISKTEEIMGIFIGNWDYDECAAHIVAIKTLPRRVKKSDRVEVGPEHLVQSSSFAEELGRKFKRTLNVIGWYHSHPNITVQPSDVDLNTQKTYQLLDRLFVGIIFSVYVKENNSQRQPVKVTCFQAGPGKNQRLEVPLVLVPHYFDEIVIDILWDLCETITGEEEEERPSSNKLDTVSRIRNSAMYAAKVIDLYKKVMLPTIEALESRVQTNNIKIQHIQDETN